MITVISEAILVDISRWLSVGRVKMQFESVRRVIPKLCNCEQTLCGDDCILLRIAQGAEELMWPSPIILCSSRWRSEKNRYATVLTQC